MGRAKIAVAALGLVLAACGTAKRKEKPESFPGPRTEAIAKAADGAGLDRRLLLAAAYVESNFGTETAIIQGAFPDSVRSPLLGLQREEVPDGKTNDLYENAQILAKKIKDAAQRIPPKERYDWFELAAFAMVGEGSDPEVRKVSASLILLELVRTYNEGFTSLLPDAEVVRVPPADEGERIDLAQLDAGRSRVANIHRLYETAYYHRGNKEAERGEKAEDTSPRIILRWCPGSALRCFDHLRQTVETPSHFLSFPGIDGKREFIQLHPLSRDLAWYNGEAKGAISITLSGLAGTAHSTYRPNWLDWEDYVQLRTTLFELLRSYPVTDALVGALASNPTAIDPYLIESRPGEIALPEMGAVPPGKPDFALPTYWDSGLFRELTRMTKTPQRVSQISIESPERGQWFGENEVFFALYPDADAARIEIYQDAEPKVRDLGQRAFPTPWDLILKRDYDARSRKVEFTHFFRFRGSTASNGRAIKVVTRDRTGTLLSSRIVPFAVDGIE